MLHQPEVRVFQTLDPSGRRARNSALALLSFVGLSLLVWAANGAATSRGVRGWYLTLVRPPLTPPGWVFPLVWTTLYVMIGVAAWLVWRPITVGAGAKRAALLAWGWQLGINALWAPVFFTGESTLGGLLVIGPLLIAILITIRRFWRVSQGAAWLMLPYAAWVGIATYLNAGFWWLNRIWSMSGT